MRSFRTSIIISMRITRITVQTLITKTIRTETTLTTAAHCTRFLQAFFLL